MKKLSKDVIKKITLTNGSICEVINPLGGAFIKLCAIKDSELQLKTLMSESCLIDGNKKGLTYFENEILFFEAQEIMEVLTIFMQRFSI